LKKWLLWIVPVVALGGLMYWRFGTKAEKEQQAQQGAGGAGGGGGGRPGGRTPVVELGKAGPRLILSTLDTVGTVESPVKAQISPKTSGRIEFIQVREGDTVRAGQVLVRIDPTELQAAVVQQQANVAEARSRLAQAQIGANPNEVSLSGAVSEQKAAVASAKATLNQAQRNYDSQVAAAQAAVSDANARVEAAQAQARNASAALQQQQASLKNLQTKYNRVQSLYKQGFIAAQEVDDAQTEMEVQERAVDVATGQVASAQATVNSAIAQRRSAEQQVAIVRRNAQAGIQTAAAQVAQEQAGLKTAGANTANSAAYRQNVSALKSAVEAAEAGLAQARARLKETTLVSPINGTVTARNADVGSLASPGQAVLEVQSLDWVFVVTSIPIEQGASIKVGQLARVTSDALPGRAYTGRVSNINPAANVQSRQFSIRLRLNNPGQSLKPGMYMRVAFDIGRVEATVAVPREAVRTTDEGSTVAVVDDEMKAENRDVKLGVSDNEYVQILSGVKSGEKVVTLTMSPVRDGQKVRLPGKGGQDGPGEGGRAGGGRP
jgi:RND family efflux transporter MFP subunit